MQRFLILFLLTTACLGAQGQQLDPNDYIYPCGSSNNGSTRPISAKSVPGISMRAWTSRPTPRRSKPVVAAADGYVSRVVLQAGGYGRAVYLTLRNGTTVVYGHLRRFRDDIERHVRRERYERRSNGVNLWFGPGTWPVKQGDVVAYSGDSGSSGGPAPPLRNPRHGDPAALQPRPRRNHPPQGRISAAHRAPALRRGRHRAGRARAQRPGELRRGPHGRRPLRPDARRTRRRGPQGLFRGRSHRPPQRCLEHLRGYGASRPSRTASPASNSAWTASPTTYRVAAMP
ncbi:MAG: M23 family metallopeptidase [Alistipes shahii]